MVVASGGWWDSVSIVFLHLSHHYLQRIRKKTYNADVVQMLYKISSNPRVTLTRKKTTNKPSLNLQSTTLHDHLMDHLKVGFVAIIIIKFSVTHWANDFLQLVFPNLICNITTTSRGNTVFLVRITYKVARINQTMFGNGISA